MSGLSASEVDHLSKLSRLSLTGEERERFAKEMPKIIDFVEQLAQVKLDQNNATGQPVELSAMRDDEVSSERLTPEELEKLAPQPLQDSQLVVPAVFGESEDD